MTALTPTPDPGPVSQTMANLLSGAARTATLAAETLKMMVRLGAVVRTVPKFTALPKSAPIPEMFRPHALGDAELIALAMLLDADPRVRKIETDLDAEIAAVGEAIPFLDVAAIADGYIAARRRPGRASGDGAQ
ncbi:MAG: hypothetical protein ACE37J_11830 [Pikeienuella sp.]|uniref:hypothetical protein n=1 Tax=Pikeienuella sp. TaxID=2831957 RepID=UPI00391A80F0